MEREEAKSKASIRIQLFDAKGANKIIDQIYNDHEAQLKALQQHKSCEGCKHYKFTYNSNDGPVRQFEIMCCDCIRSNTKDNYKLKEQWDDKGRIY